MKKPLYLKNRKDPSDHLIDTDIDVTPIMNMFIILIPFLVSMAVFTKLAILEFNVPANSGKNLSKGTPKLKLTLVVNNKFILFTQGSQLLDSIGIKDEFKLEDVKETLSLLKDSISVKNEAVLSVNDSVNFDDIVTVMDACKSEGFTKLGLSGTAE